MRSVLTLSRITMLIVCVIAPIVLLAQPGNPNTPAPFGFIEILAGGALAYGAYQSKKKAGKNKK